MGSVRVKTFADLIRNDRKRREVPPPTKRALRRLEGATVVEGKVFVRAEDVRRVLAGLEVAR